MTSSDVAERYASKLTRNTRLARSRAIAASRAAVVGGASVVVISRSSLHPILRLEAAKVARIARPAAAMPVHPAVRVAPLTTFSAGDGATASRAAAALESRRAWTGLNPVRARHEPGRRAAERPGGVYQGKRLA